MTAIIDSDQTPLREAPDSAIASNPFLAMPRAAVWAFILFGVLYTLVVCSVALFRATEAGISMVWVSLSSAWLLFWVFYPLLFYKPTYGWCHPLILPALLSIANLVIRNTGMFIGGLPEHVMLPDWFPDDLNKLYAYANFVSSLALIATYVGFAAGVRLPMPNLRPPATPGRRFYIVLLAAVSLSLAAFYFYGQVFGGLGNHLKSLAYGMSKKIELANNLDGIGQYTVLMNVATVATIVWVCTEANALRNPLFWLAAACSLALAYMSEGKRSSMIYPGILIMLCWMLRNKRVPYLRLAGVGVAAFLLIGLLGLFRSSNWTDKESLNLDVFQETSISEIGSKSMEEISRRSGSEYTYFPILAKVPSQEPLLFGKSYLEWGLRFVPRELWPDKPRGVDVQANLAFYGADWGLPPGPVGEAYWNFHIPGVLGVFFLIGVFKRWLGALLVRYPNAPAVMGLYMISLVYFDGSQNGFRIWVYSVIPAFVLLKLGGLIGGRRLRHSFTEPSIDSRTNAASA